MKILPGLIVACGALAAAQARPLVIQESARLASPDPSYTVFAGDVAIDGDDALIMMSRNIEPPPDDPYAVAGDVAAYLFRRANGTWTPVRPLVTQHYDYMYIATALAMQNGVAAVLTGGLGMFERRNGDWVSVPIAPGGPYSGPGGDLTIDGGRILSGGSDGTWQGTLFEKDAANGSWRATSVMYGDPRSGDVDNEGGPVDLSGSRAVILSRYSDESPASDSTPGVAVYRDGGPPTAFFADGQIRNDPQFAPLGFEVAVRGDEIFIAGTNASGTRVYRKPGTYWTESDQLRPLDSHMGAGVTNNIKKNDLYIMQHSWSAEREAYVINVFAKTGGGLYDHVATLVASNGSSLGLFGISGRRVMAGCGGEACYFELPTSLAQPAPIADTFTGATATGWTLSAGSNFSVVQSGVSRVLRQSDTASPATHTAQLTAANWSNQSIQADVRPTAFSGSDRWFGLASRYRDASNYYYVTVRSSGSVSLRRNVNGVFSAVASAPLTVTLNRTYRVRLESIGTRHRVYVDGAAVLDADDSALTSGRPALLTYRTAAEFDNVFASPSPAAPLFVTNFEPNGPRMDLWTESGPGLWTHELRGDVPNNVFTQNSVAGDARAVIGVPTDIQSVDARIRPTTFAGTGSGDRWFGVLARYSDTSNYYYLSVRSGNTVSLRKVAGGTVTVLGTAPLPVSIGTWYPLRLEAIGTRLRAYVNGALVLEASDATHARGATGLVTYRTAADFDDYRAIQP